MDSSVPHVTSLTLPQEELRHDFIKITHTQIPDTKWHFETVVHKSTRMGPPPAKPPVAGGDVVQLAIFNRPQPPCDLEVFGVHLTQDINPADWLDLWLERQGHAQVLSRKRFPSIGGTIGDVLARWQVEGVPWIGRFFVTKAGPRVFLLWARTAEADYAKLAEPIFLSIMSFRILDTSAGPLAEGVRWVNGNFPVPWKLALPASWHGTVQPGNQQAAAFEAAFLAPAAPNAVPQILGKMSFAIIAPDLIKEGPALGANCLTALKSAGVIAESSEFAQEPHAEPYTAAWYLETKATLNANPVAVHGRILRHPKAWIAATVVSPAREVQPALWMQARRLLDIVTMTLAIDAA